MSNIASIRRRRGLKQEHLAEMVGVSQPHISRIENGDDGPPLRMFKDIADALGVSLPALFSDDLSERESELLQVFRRIPKAKHAELLAALRLAQADSDEPDRGTGQSGAGSSDGPRQ